MTPHPSKYAGAAEHFLPLAIVFVILLIVTVGVRRRVRKRRDSGDEYEERETWAKQAAPPEK